MLADLEKGKFLFEMDFDDYIHRLSNGISNIMECKKNIEKLPGYCAEFIRAAAEIELKLIPMVEKELRLK